MRRFISTCVAVISLIPVAHADVIFDFSGTCTSGDACLASTYTGVLDLNGAFTPGEVVQPADVVSFSLNGSQFNPFGRPASTGTNICGLPAAVGCSGQNLGLVNIGSPAGNFFTFADGSWRLDTVGSFLPVQGTNGTWVLASQTPLPPSALLLASAMGALAMGGMLRRKART